VKVEWLILADGAQTVGNKLYLLGGGWDVLTVSGTLPVQRHIALAASFLVPWSETNMKHNFEIEMLHEDGASIAKIGGQFEVGRPPGIPAGSDQRSQFAVDMGLTLERGGVYVIVARIEGEEAGKTSFRVVAGKPIQVPGVS
jgi:hypothetical protein